MLYFNGNKMSSYLCHVLYYLWMFFSSAVPIPVDQQTQRIIILQFIQEKGSSRKHTSLLSVNRFISTGILQHAGLVISFRFPLILLPMKRHLPKPDEQQALDKPVAFRVTKADYLKRNLDREKKTALGSSLRLATCPGFLGLFSRLFTNSTNFIPYSLLHMGSPVFPFTLSVSPVPAYFSNFL